MLDIPSDIFLWIYLWDLLDRVDGNQGKWVKDVDLQIYMFDLWSVDVVGLEDAL